MHRQTVLAPKLQLPRTKARCLRRPRLDELFVQVLDYPVTLVQADAGYGKTTALVTHLCTHVDHVAWYSIEKGERDTRLFLHYLVHALNALHPQIGERTMRLFEEAESGASSWQAGLTLLINDLAEWAPDPSVVVLDDYHAVAGVEEIEGILDVLIRYLPAQVHLVIGSRQVPTSAAVKRLQSTYDLLLMDKETLAFRTEEVQQLFEEAYGIALSDEQVQELQEQTEGWIIALQMVWKGLQRGIELSAFWKAQNEGGADAGLRLFHYLAEEVFDRQPAETQAFLLRTCLLHTMEPDLCDRLLGQTQSADVLAGLERDGLFVASLGPGVYRYHRLFQRFLITHAKTALLPAEWSALQSAAGEMFWSLGDGPTALAHWQAAGDQARFVEVLLQLGEECLQTGRLELLRGWIDGLSSDWFELHPELPFWRGEIARGLSRFHEAGHWYTLAEGAYIRQGDTIGRSRVYRGQAQIYLDTVQPSGAIRWLELAVQVLGDRYPEPKSHVLRLLAENYANSGELNKAAELIQQADALVPYEVRDELDARICLRTGRLQEAKAMTLTIMAREVEEGRHTQRVAKSHRELHLLLSLIDSFLGEGESSRHQAELGIGIGQALRSPFVEAVGYMRLGHAYALAHELEQAQQFYQTSMRMSDELRVERGKVEALMGLCNTAGLLGELEQAVAYGREGLALAIRVEDYWCANLLRLSLGMVNALWGQDEEALPWLVEAETGFAACGDRFGVANAQLWRCVGLQRSGGEAVVPLMRELLETVDRYGYDNLFLKRTLFGPCDLHVTVPALLAARDEGSETAERLLRHLGMRGVTAHPGYSLRVQTLGKFEVYRGLEAVGRKEWKREKSRQLFQLLVTRRGHLLQKEELYERLWPEVDEKTANRDFKVALHALANVLEPKREARAESFFLERGDGTYRLVRGTSVWVDADEFASRAEQGLALADREPLVAERQLEAALVLYQGEYLQHSPYLEWCQEERDRLRTLYARALEHLAELRMARGRYAEAVQACEQLLRADASWEAAYRLLMTCHHQRGERNLVIAAYKRCVAQLEDLLGLSPLEETTRLYQRLMRR